MNCHIFIWRYEKEFLTSKQCFEPSVKLRVVLSYNKFVRAGEQKLFPDKDIDPTK